MNKVIVIILLAFFYGCSNQGEKQNRETVDNTNPKNINQAELITSSEEKQIVNDIMKSGQCYKSEVSLDAKDSFINGALYEMSLDKLGHQDLIYNENLIKKIIKKLTECI